MTTTPEHGSTFTIGDSIKVKALHTPCHTQDSICYLFEDGSDKAVFTGDTLFIGGGLELDDDCCSATANVNRMWPIL